MNSDFFGDGVHQPGQVQKYLEKIGVEAFDEDEMKILTDFAFEQDELCKTVKNLGRRATPHGQPGKPSSLA